MALTTLARPRFLASLTLVAIALGNAASHAQAEAAYVGQVRDAWLHGKLETALRLNTQLGSVAIRTSVLDGVAHLQGEVATETDRDVASAIAESIEGISGLVVDLAVEPSGVVLTASSAHLLCEIVSDPRRLGRTPTTAF